MSVVRVGVPLEKEFCMDFIAVKGKAIIQNKLVDKWIIVKRIQHGKLTMNKSD